MRLNLEDPRHTSDRASCLQYNPLKETGDEKTSGKDTTASPLMVRLDAESKRALAAAAQLRRISISDYVRSVTVSQARREVASARDQTILLSPDEQLAFWQALNGRSKLTPAQKRLGAIMRGTK